jgi:hypothetical protein
VTARCVRVHAAIRDAQRSRGDDAEGVLLSASSNAVGAPRIAGTPERSKARWNLRR